MKKVLIFVLVIIVASASFWHVSKGTITGGFGIISPLPELLFPTVLGVNTNYWKPSGEELNKHAGRPNLTAKSYLSYDLATDKYIYAHNENVRVPMASLTKIMTAIIALENASLSEEMEVSQEAAEIGENSMGLEEGEVLKLEDLLYGLILHSGNDAAEVIAEKSQFGRENFVYLMNKKAEDIGLSDTHFTNPSGLEGDGNQYSTANNLLILTRYALQNEDFARIVATVNYDIPATEKHKEFHLFNETNLLTSYRGVKGVKTGYTYEAGLCLITYLEYEDHKIIAVLLNAQNRRQEMKDLLDYSLKSLGVNPPPHT